MQSYSYLFLLSVTILACYCSASSLPSSTDDEKVLSNSTKVTALFAEEKSIDLSEDDLRMCKEIIAQIREDEKEEPVNDNDQFRLSRVTRHTASCNSQCYNGGRCRSQTRSYCSCRTGYTGTRCHQRRGRLRIYVKYASSVRDADGIFAGRSDPYVSVQAVTYSGRSVYKKTRYIGSDLTPHWYQWLDFGTNNWRMYYIQVWDYDRGPSGDDALSNRHMFYTAHGRINKRVSTHGGGSLYFDSDF